MYIYALRHYNGANLILGYTKHYVTASSSAAFKARKVLVANLEGNKPPETNNGRPIGTPIIHHQLAFVKTKLRPPVAFLTFNV